MRLYLGFESAVEDQEYYADDVEFALTAENLSSKKKEKVYSFIRMLPQ